MVATIRRHHVSSEVAFVNGFFLIDRGFALSITTDKMLKSLSSEKMDTTPDLRGEITNIFNITKGA